MSALTIAPARRGDLPDILDLFEETWREHDARGFGAFGPPPRAARAHQLRRSFRVHWRWPLPAWQAPLLLVARVSGVFAGHIHVEQFATNILYPDISAAAVSDLSVAAGYRRQGVARALLQTATKACRDRGIDHMQATVWTGNERSAQFFAAADFRLTANFYELALTQASDEVNPLG